MLIISAKVERETALAEVQNTIIQLCHFQIIAKFQPT